MAGEVSEVRVRQHSDVPAWQVVGDAHLTGRLTARGGVDDGVAAAEPIDDLAEEGEDSDGEARAAVNSILAVLRAHGFVEPSPE